MKFDLTKNTLSKYFVLVVLGLLFVVLQFNVLEVYPFKVNGVNLAVRLNETFSSFISLIIAAFPFIILGIVISILLALYVKEEKILKLIPRNRYLSHLTMGFLGMLLPVCECGNIPVARRFLSKGFTVSQVTTFLLAAPIVNPITFITTLQAFNMDSNIAFFRIGSGFLIASFIGILVSYKKVQNELLTGVFSSRYFSERSLKISKRDQAMNIFQTEFIEIFKMLVFGALIAAILQNFLPDSFIQSIGSNPILSILSMILLAFIISVCSNIDAFIASSYSSTFTLGSVMAFMVFGPMIDIKMFTILKSTFKTKFLFLLIGLVFLFAFCTGLLINVFYREFI